MVSHDNLGQIIYFAYENIKSDDVVIIEKGGSFVLSKWNRSEPEPTQEEIDTIASSKEFLDFKSDPKKIKTRKIKGRISRDKMVSIIIDVVVEEINALRSKHQMEPRLKEDILNSIASKIE